MFRYTVQCEFTGGDENLVQRWLAWLNPDHIREVIECGALSGEVIRLESENPTFAINYTFLDKAAFEKYEQQHAPRLRDEGLQLFPLKSGLVYSRTTSEIIATVTRESGA